MLNKLKLIKRKTDDGLMEIEDNIPLGKIYEVDLSTKKSLRGMNIQTGQLWERLMVQIDGQWFPLELLEVIE